MLEYSPLLFALSLPFIMTFLIYYYLKSLKPPSKLFYRF